MSTITTKETNSQSGPSTTQATLHPGAAPNADQASMQEQCSHNRRWPTKNEDDADKQIHVESRPMKAQPPGLLIVHHQPQPLPPIPPQPTFHDRSSYASSIGSSSIPEMCRCYRCQVARPAGSRLPRRLHLQVPRKLARRHLPLHSIKLNSFLFPMPELAK